MIELQCENGIMTGKSDGDNVEYLIYKYFVKRKGEKDIVEFVLDNIKEQIIIDNESPSSFSITVPFSDTSSLIIADEEIKIEGKKGDELMSVFCQIMAKESNIEFDDFLVAVTAYDLGIVHIPGKTLKVQ